MEEKLIFNNILTLTKDLSGILYHGTLESSTQNAHDTFHKKLDECLGLQNEIFNFMMRKGWYTMEQVEQQKIEQVKNKYSCK